MITLKVSWESRHSQDADPGDRGFSRSVLSGASGHKGVGGSGTQQGLKEHVLSDSTGRTVFPGGKTSA